MAVVEFEAPVEVLTEREQRARTLEAAALEGDVRGWTHSVIEADDGQVCLVGAINKAQGYDGADVYGKARKAWGGATSMPLVAGTHDARILGAALYESEYDPAFVLRWRAEEIRDGWDA
jgi:hypothetical protein